VQRPDEIKDDVSSPFGYRTVVAADKAAMVQRVFASVSGRYDLMNDMMSLGIHRMWKRALMDMLAPKPDTRLLDVACGTGDIALRFLSRGGGHVTACDRNMQMVEAGRARAIDKGVLSAIRWVVGDAEDLPCADSSVDAYTIAFGLRNVTHIDNALAEAVRVLEPGGRFMCLEFAPEAASWLEPLYRRYSFAFLPALGQVVTGDGAAYRYLVESIRRFPKQAALSERITAAGFDVVKHRNLTGGIVAIHSAWRI
jgi:demethylmenaquinone methyltransferase/2-methoxy-6-polyprenyl-1,4-benzoquinol methylase